MLIMICREVYMLSSLLFNFKFDYEEKITFCKNSLLMIIFIKF